MTPLARHHSIFFLIMRRMRAPLILLIVIMAISVLGLTLTPGVDADGNPNSLSFFHAFYFISYTATTIGFGEIPQAFSDQQRLWVIFCIYMSVVGWTYTLGTAFALLGDRGLQQAIRTQRFVRVVRRLREPFYLVCGYGETGRLICRALDRLGYRAVVLEADENKVGEIDLHSYVADLPALTANASNPETLQFAGLTHRHCVGVIALTNDDSANLSIAITARLLAPRLPALCRAETRETAANMGSFGTRRIINPFEKFSEYLALALHAPAAWHLLTWLTGQPGTVIERRRNPPRGQWIVCGNGRFGRMLVDAMDTQAVPVTIIDRVSPDDPSHPWVQGDGTNANALERAGVRSAAGIVACTGNDVDNLSIAVTARERNPGLFVIARQNHYANHALFEAFNSDITVIPSEIIANECLALLATPLLAPFLGEIKRRDEEWCGWVLERMTQRFGWAAPSVWSERINLVRTPALHRRLMRGERIEIGAVLRTPANRHEAAACEILYMRRDDDDEPLLIPSSETCLRSGDELLFIGHEHARHDLALILANEQTLTYVLTGDNLPAGPVWEFLSRRQRRPQRH